jgi:hypothetical protein
MSKGSVINMGRRNRRQSKHKEAEPRLGVVDRLARAAARQSERAQRTAAQQLAELDRRLGVGKGAMKERLRLLDKITGRKVA